jgi:transposase
LKKEQGWEMYIEIQQLKKLGLTISQIARKLGISRPTVYEYINITPDEFNKRLEEMQQRSKRPDQYHDKILSWLLEYPDLSAAQIYDWLEEEYKELNFSESTLRNYVRILRKKYNINKEPITRQYEAVVDPPMGKQAQVDFGEKWVYKKDGSKVKLYVMAFVLSHSRYKYCEWQDRPFNASDIIRIHENAFEYFGGMPEELVYDQDHLILVSENHGDLIYTHQFSAYVQTRKFKIYMCRKGDPESKGRIEKVVDFVKNNFAHNRTFYNIQKWNEDTLTWLDRRGNGKVHGTTKRKPAEVFNEERKYLRPVLEKIQTKSTGLSITYQVRKDNTVVVEGNRYSVPLGTYQGPYTYVRVRKINNEYIVIMHLDNDEELARHKIPLGKGNLQKNNNHTRETSKKIPALMTELAFRFPDPIAAEDFFENIRIVKPRYIRDQLLVIKEAINGQPSDVIEKALNFCIRNKLYSAVDFKDAVKHYAKEQHSNTTTDKSVEIISLSSTSMEKIKTKPQIRDISEYTEILKQDT